MPLEIGSTINDLAPANPPGSDPAGQGDDHLRLIKACVQGTFPQMGSIFSTVRSQDTALSISSIWNTNHFISSASATATVVLTLPPAASITSGFYVDLTTLAGASISLLPSGADTVNGAAAFTIPPQYTARAFFQGGSVWHATKYPAGFGSSLFGENVTIAGTLSVSGATTLNAVTISGAATLNSTLLVSGATNLAGALSVSGAAVLSSTLSVSGQTVLAGLTVKGTTTLSATVVLTVGQLQFPASQNASANANTLDDYEEGTWTPSVAFISPGDLIVTYSSRSGEYIKIGKAVLFNYSLITSAFTYSTASGNLIVTGLPFMTGNNTYNQVLFSGLTTIGAGYIDVSYVTAAGQVYGVFQACGASLAIATLNTVQAGNGATLNLQGSGQYTATA